MDILQNKKALAGMAAGAVIVLALAFFMFMGGGEEVAEEEPAEDVAATEATAPEYVDPTASVDAVATDASGDAATAKALPPLERAKGDPFASLIPRVNPRVNRQLVLQRQAEREVFMADPLTIYNPRPTAEADTGTLRRGGEDLTALPPDTGQDTTQRRVAGLVVGRNAYAILEIDGQTAVVKPGDILPDLSRVERIERDRVVLRRGDRTIPVPLSASPDAAATGGGGTGAGGYTGGRGGSYPGGSYPGAGRSGYPTGAGGYTGPRR